MLVGYCLKPFLSICISFKLVESVCYLSQTLWLCGFYRLVWIGSGLSAWGCFSGFVLYTFLTNRFLCNLICFNYFLFSIFVNASRTLLSLGSLAYNYLSILINVAVFNFLRAFIIFNLIGIHFPIIIIFPLNTGIFKFFSHFFQSNIFGGRYEEFRIIVGRSYIGNAFISLFNKFLEQQIIARGHMVMLVGLNALPGIVLVNVKLSLHSVEQCWIDRNWVDSHLNAFKVRLARNYTKPRMLSNLFNCVPLLRICI